MTYEFADMLCRNHTIDWQNKELARTRYTLESFQYLNTFNCTFLEKLNTRILNLSTYVKWEFKKLYIAYKMTPTLWMSLSKLAASLGNQYEVR